MLRQLTVLIVTWHGDDLLRPCLESLRRSVKDFESLEVVVVDNGNQPSTRLIAQDFGARYVPTKENLGFAGGNNEGIPYCTRKYVLLLNNDTVVHDEPFTTLVRYLEDHPNVGVVQGALNIPMAGGGVLDTCGTMLTTIGKLHACDHMVPTATTPLSERVVYSVKGALLMFRRELLDRTGGLFHSEYFNNFEETDFCHRVWLTGHEVRFVPTPPVDHLYNATIRKMPRPPVQAKELANILFTYHSLFGWRGKLRVLPLFYAYRFLMCLRSAIAGRWSDAAVFFIALKDLWRRRHLLQAEQDRARGSCRITDKELFAKVMFRPPRGYWRKILVTWLSGTY